MKKIQKTIDVNINPMLKLHNGRCEAVSFDNGILSIHLFGGCSGCPASKITLMNLIKPILQEKHPETIKDI